MERTIFEKRYALLQSHLVKQDLEAGLVTDPVNIYYLTGWRTDPHERFTSLFVPREGSPFLVLPAMDLESAGTGWVRDLQAWKDGENPYHSLAKGAQGAGFDNETLAVEKANISLEQFEGVVEALKPTVTWDLRPLLDGLRVIKGEEELNLLRQAADIACNALESVIELIRPGVTEREIADLLDRAVRWAGGDGPAFDTIVLSGPRSALPHGRPGDRVIDRGDLVLLDFGAAYRGYLSDITRTFCVGPWPKDLATVYDAVLSAHDAAIEMVAPGNTMEQVDRAARRVIEERGFGQCFIHRTGHGLGLAIHEEPYFVEGSHRKLEPGMVGTIEPGIYLPGVGGVRIEDDVAVTPTGNTVLSRRPTGRQALG